MARVHLVHWNESEAAQSIARLRKAGHEVSYQPQADAGTLRQLRASPPDAVIIDLSRLPSHGREFAVALRGSKNTRAVPLVFCGGDQPKVAAIRALLPDACYTQYAGLLTALKRAIAHPPAAAFVPVQMMDRYAGRTAAAKLGIREGSSVALIDPPREYAAVLGDLPPDVRFHEDEQAECAVTLWFVSEPDGYRSQLAHIREFASRSRLWILWRKGRRDFNETAIRETALQFGLVDYKVCSVNSVWSGLLFARA